MSVDFKTNYTLAITASDLIGTEIPPGNLDAECYLLSLGWGLEDRSARASCLQENMKAVMVESRQLTRHTIQGRKAVLG